MAQRPTARPRPGALEGRPTRPGRGDPRSLAPPVRVRRAISLLLLTLLVPGSAQLVAGNPRIGRLALRCWLTVLGLAALIGAGWFLARDAVLGLLTAPLALGLIATGCYLCAAGMLVLTADAWRLGRPILLPRRARLVVAVLTAVVMLLTAGPLFGVGRRAWAAADLIGAVFASGRVSPAVDGRYNVLLLGGDAGPDRVGTRPDSVTLASIDTSTGRTVLFSLPRNLENVPFPAGSAAFRALPQGFSCGDGCLLNGLYTWGGAHRSVFPGAADPGAEAMKEAVEGATGLTVNYYVLIDLQGFEQLINAVGGIELTVRAPVPIGGGTAKVSGYIRAGRQRLDGYHALWFARSRHGGSDYDRMARQRCVMDAMLHQLTPATVLADFQGIASASRQVVSTDLPASELSTFLTLAEKAKSQRITSVQFVPPLVNPAYPDYAMIRSTVRNAIAASRGNRPGASRQPAGTGGTARSGSSAPARSSSASSPSPATSPASSSWSTAGATAGRQAGPTDPVDVNAVCSAAGP